MSHHGAPCWYELTTSKGNLDAAGAFYSAVLGWSVTDAGMEEFTYHLASMGDAMVAGLMEMPDDVAGMPPAWMLYFAVEDADVAVSKMTAAGALVHRPVTPIPGTGRFAILADPQGAGFGILEPAPMEDGPQQGRAFDPSRPGLGNWNELVSSDRKAAMRFYCDQFGWTPSQVMDMGDMGSYDLFAWNGADIGAMMAIQPGMPPVGGFWMPYFGVEQIEAAMDRVKQAGGVIHQGPHEVPGGVFIATGADPQGAVFAMVGPK